MRKGVVGGDKVGTGYGSGELGGCRTWVGRESDVGRSGGMANLGDLGGI